MLSDEEKKAVDKINKLVEYLRKWNKNFTIVPADIKYFEKILDMIKTYIRMIDENIEEILEQSKEIEELKEENKEIYQTGYVNGCVSKVYEINKKWKDKIKAKIEELEKQDRENRMSCNYLVIPVLQSLLEKE